MNTTKAYLAGVGTTGLLVGSIVVLLVLGSGLAAVDGLPDLAQTPAPLERVVLKKNGPKAGQRDRSGNAARRLAARRHGGALGGGPGGGGPGGGGPVGGAPGDGAPGGGGPGGRSRGGGAPGGGSPGGGAPGGGSAGGGAPGGGAVEGTTGAAGGTLDSVLPGAGAPVTEIGSELGGALRR